MGNTSTIKQIYQFKSKGYKIIWDASVQASVICSHFSKGSSTERVKMPYVMTYFFYGLSTVVTDTPNTQSNACIDWLKVCKRPKMPVFLFLYQ